MPECGKRKNQGFTTGRRASISIETKNNNWSLHSNFKEGETIEAHSITLKWQLGSQQREGRLQKQA